MNYSHAKFVISPFDESIADMISFLISDLGFDSFQTDNSSLSAFAPSKSLPDNAEQLIKEQLLLVPEEYAIHFTLTTEEGANWNEEWEKNYFKPLIIGNQCVVRSSFHTDFPAAQYDIVIDPKMAFGTGNHETTSLMIEQILKIDPTGLNVLDMGCGTAILSILIAMRGAATVVGIDIEEPAYENALENIALNHVPTVEIRLGDAEQIRPTERFNIILANINRNVLLNDLHHYANHLAPNGQLLMSGFYEQDIPLIKEEAQRHGLRLHSYESKNNWVMTLFVNNH